MSRWDSSNYDRYADEEESRLLRKFYDYAEIEKKESERKRFLEISDKKTPSAWGNRFVLSAIIQGAIITGLTVALILMQTVFTDAGLMEFLSLSLDGPAKWFFFGYFMYITLVVAITITAIFYNHLESNMGRIIRGRKKYLAWAQLVGMNVGGAATTILLIIAGFVGTGFVDFVSGGQSDKFTIEAVKLPVTIAAFVFAAGIIAGGVAYISTYVGKQGPKIGKITQRDEFRKYDRL